MARIIFQGELGANSHIACQNVYPDHDVVPKDTFEDCFTGMARSDAELAMIPIENNIAGRVADVHHHIPDAGLYIIGEYFLPIHHQLLAKPGTKLEDITEVQSHIMALGQCRKFISKNSLTPIVGADTAGSARQIKSGTEATRGAIATRLAAEVYGLDILVENIEDTPDNITRFVILAREPLKIDVADHDRIITTFVFKVGNIPAALYKCLGGFATNGVNITKLESYQLEGRFEATQFYADIEGHPDEPPVQRALDELKFFTANQKGVRILGTYPGAH